MKTGSPIVAGLNQIRDSNPLPMKTGSPIVAGLNQLRDPNHLPVKTGSPIAIHKIRKDSLVVTVESYQPSSNCNWCYSHGDRGLTM